MSLCLKLLCFGEDIVESGLGATISAGGGSIGRAKGNDLVLPDKEGYVSRVHAKIESDGETFFVVDCSSNGTLLLEPIVGGAEDEYSEILIHDDRKPIRDGGYIIIGEFEIFAEYCENSVMEESLIHADFDSPVIKNVSPTEKNGDNNIFKPPVFPHSPSVQPKQETYEAESNANVSAVQSSFSISNAQQDLGVKEPIPEEFNIDDFFGEDNGFAEEHKEDDILSGLEEPVIDEKPLENSIEPNDALLPGDVAVDLNKPVVADNSAVDLLSGLKPPVDLVRENTAVESGIKEVDLKPKIQSVERNDSAQVKQTVQHKEGNNTFFKALGIDILKLPDNEVERDQLLFHAGKMLRTLLESNMSLLKARADVKREFSSSMTVVQKEENNPLKFCQSVDEALLYLLFDDSPGFLSGQSAIDESVQDLCAHQMSMMSGIQGGLQGVMKKFDPVGLESDCEVGHFNKSSKLWDFYVSNYKKLSKEAQTEFFGSDFSEAYERQARAMKNSR